MAGAGFFGLRAIDRAIDKAKAYQAQLSLLKATGADQREIALDTAAAWKTAGDVLTTSAADNLKAIRELRSVLGAGNTGAVSAVLPAIQRMSGSLTALTGRTPDGLANDVVRTTELRGAGLVTPEAIQRNAELMSRTVMAMGGTVVPSDFHATMKQAKLSGLHLNDDFVYNVLPFLMQEAKTGHGGGGAQTVGTSLMSTYQAIIGGTLKKSALPLWMEAGLIKPSDVVRNSTGAMQLRPGAVRDGELFQANPYAWVQKDLAPAIERIVKRTGKTQEQVLAGMFGNRNVQMFVGSLLEKRDQIERDRATISKAPTSAVAYNQLAQSNPALASLALQKQWDDLQVQLAYDVLPKLIAGTKFAADELSTLNNFLVAHKTIAKMLGEGFTALFAALAFRGTLKTATGALRLLGDAAAFEAVGGARTISKAAKALDEVGTSVTFDKVGGVSKLGKVAGALKLIGSNLDALAGAWWAGTKIGNEARRGLDKVAQGASGDKNDTLGGFLHDQWHPFNPATGKRELSLWHGLTDSDDDTKSNRIIEANYHRMWDLGMHRWLTPQESIARDVQPLGGSNLINGPAYGPDAGKQVIQVSAYTTLDGKVLTKTVTENQYKLATKPQNGTSFFDTSQFAAPIGYTGAQ